MIFREITWVVFDFYGVIAVDSTQAAARLIQDEKVVRQVGELNNQKDEGKLELNEYIRRLAFVLNVSEERAQWLENPLDSSDPKLVEYIRQLHQTGKKIAIASNSYAASLRKAIKVAGLRGSVDVVVSSSELGVIKPQVEFWRLLEKRLGVSPAECLLVDDREQNCEAARQYGFQTWHYDSFGVFKTYIEKSVR